VEVVSAWDEVTCADCLEEATWGAMSRRWNHRSGRVDHPVKLPPYHDSTLCPRCGGKKNLGFPLCKSCEAREAQFLPPNRRKAPSQVLQERRDAARAAEAAQLTDDERERYGLPRSDCGCPQCNHGDLLALGLRHGSKDLTEWETEGLGL
jgi:hypothetical protein